MRMIGLLFITLVLVMGAFFTALNAQSVEVNYLIGQITLPLAVIVLGPFIIGLLLSSLYFGIKTFVLKNQINRLEKRIKKLNAHSHQVEPLLKDIK